MDHHCVWLNNCIGYYNHKPFLLFLIYASLLAIFCGVESGKVVYAFFTDIGGDDVSSLAHLGGVRGPDAPSQEIVDFKPVSHLMVCMAGLIFTLSIGSFTLFHLYLVA